AIQRKEPALAYAVRDDLVVPLDVLCLRPIPYQQVRVVYGKLQDHYSSIWYPQSEAVTEIKETRLIQLVPNKGLLAIRNPERHRDRAIFDEVVGEGVGEGVEDVPTRYT
ncbi:MAG TPA: hypothetical protein PL001_03680, partial [Candidatus Kryptobacter bacterium]|nr:hypothetical protein [Candidatus Kryptobacter bacterium]